MLVFDGDGAVMGRLATKVAKHLINGEEVHIINAEKILISGNKNQIVEKYMVRRRLKSRQNPEKSPKWPKMPDLLVRRVVRGMLPRKKFKGRAALKKLRVYIGNPKNFEKAEKIETKELVKRITVGELCAQLGWRG
ncbi:MAG: 50S ribosomal protein L13 [Candidatus Anstonellales archaeon]